MGHEGTRASKWWAAVATRLDAHPVAAPHPATAAAQIGSMVFASSILPWRGSGGDPPWRGAAHGDRMANCLAALEPFLAEQDGLVWGGDWNQALVGKDYVGSAAGRRYLLSTVDRLGLSTPTAALPHRIDGLSSIDHIALGAPVRRAMRVTAAADGLWLSDHDMYVVEA